jgi:GAF domain-containing protein
MVAPPDETTADPYAVIAALRAERDALAEALAQRTSEYGERIEHQSATIDVLKAMSASPGDPQPVLDLISGRMAELCASRGGIFDFDGTMFHLRTMHGWPPDVEAAYRRFFPLSLEDSRSLPFGRAVLERRIIHTPDIQADASIPSLAVLGGRSIVAVPLLRGGVPLGVIGLNGNPPGDAGFSDTQIALLQTFAGQAVIAITSAETYRALQGRTRDLQEALEYQTATSDVLKVISRSTFDLQPVLDTVTETAARLCDADMAAIGRPVGNLWRLAANFGFSPEFEAHQQASHPLGPASPAVTARAVREKVPVHIQDVAAVPGYPDASIRLGKQRTSLGVPLLREGEVM